MTKRHIILPPLQVWSDKHSFGRLTYTIRTAVQMEIESSDPVKVSPRREETALTLSSGERVIVCKNRKTKRPSSVDGVLFEYEDGSLSWITHKELEQFESDFASVNWTKLKASINDSWRDAVRFRTELRDSDADVVEKGLRAPQIGALHAIGAHWSIHSSTATIVMPTGTGKTEAMLASLVNYVRGTLLVVVPSRALRDQTAHKFKTLGLLRSLGCLVESTKNPIVAVVEHRVKDPTELEHLRHCNVIVATIGTVAQGQAVQLADQLAGICTHLIFDEAHHVPAETYTTFRDAFKDKYILQFTATPFRRDGKQLEGKTIFSYSLAQAQRDGYFRPITFKPVFELNDKSSDPAIASAGITQLEKDLNDGFDHLLMARCTNMQRAKEVFEIYKIRAAKYNPVLVVSDYARDNKTAINKLRKRQSRVVVCVNMLGEGFDLPELKIAAVHDVHKSIAILLQFAGRFTRDAGAKVGNATVIANIANQNVSVALERLYGEDADWNKLLSELSSQHIKNYSKMVEFIRKSRRIDRTINDESGGLLITSNNMRPSFSVTAYKAQSFTPEKFTEGLSKDVAIRAAWINDDDRTLYIVTEQHLRTKWTASKIIRDRQWDLYVAYFAKDQETLFLHCSDTTVPLWPLAFAVGGTGVRTLDGDRPFRTLFGISRLMFQNIGLKKPGRRNLRYSMYSGADVANALSAAEKSTSVKVNVSAHGFNNGEPVTVACSAKGRVWSHDRGLIPELLDWCDTIADKLNDDTIDVEKIIENVLIPKQVDQLPDTQVICIDWPHEIYSNPEESIKFGGHGDLISLSHLSIRFEDPLSNKASIRFQIVHQVFQSTYELKLVNTDRGFEVAHIGGPALTIKKGKFTVPVHEYFQDYPPNILYVDGSELDGCYHVEPKDRLIGTFPKDKLESWDWTGVSLKIESMWKDGKRRANSIQERVANEFAAKFEIVFDDDDSGEAADLVLLAEGDSIELMLIHCKFSEEDTPGQRVKDVVEVCSQAVRSSKRIWKFDDLITHLMNRESKQLGGRPTRFLKGTASRLAAFKKASRFKDVKASIVIVQPGLSKQNITNDQSIVLSAAESHLLETVGLKLTVICSD